MPQRHVLRGSLLSRDRHKPVLDLLGDAIEALVNIQPLFGTCLEEMDVVALPHFLPFFFAYYPLLLTIALIADQDLVHALPSMQVDLCNPIVDSLKRLAIGDVVDEHDAHGTAVVGRRDGAEPLLARRVPDLKLDLLAIKLNSSNLKINPCIKMNETFYHSNWDRKKTA